MTELYPSDQTLNALSGSNDIEQGVAYPAIYESPYYTTFYKMLYRLLDVARRAGDLRVYKDGASTFGVRSGMFYDGDALRTFEGMESQSLTDNTTNYIYLLADGALTVSTTGFPTPSVTPHIPLATIAAASGEYDHEDLCDYRACGFLSIQAGLTGVIKRDQLATEDMAIYPINLLGLMTGLTAPGNPVNHASAADGVFELELSGGTLALIGHESVSTTLSNYLYGGFSLPPEYKAAGDMTLTLHVHHAGAGTAGDATVDLEVYKLASDGSVGSDLCVTDAQDIDGVNAAYAFIVTSTSLTPGDRLYFKVSTSVQETGGVNPLKAVITSAAFRMDIQG